MHAKQPSMLTGQVIRDGLSYILRGGLHVKNAHLPSSNHIVPTEFIGICVASAPDPATDDYVISQLDTLGIKQVRLDFSYSDLNGFNARFLRALIANNFSVSLHLVQPFAAASNMQSGTEQVIWQQFLVDVLDSFGRNIKHIEIGTTINRKRWAGYTFDGFLRTWEIAHSEIKVRGITLAGPNIQDFEPLYNISLLKTFKQKNQLPDTLSAASSAER
jgi:hypothetical protein